MSGNFAIKGGGGGPLMGNAILNFHFDFLKPSLKCFESQIRVALVLWSLDVDKQRGSWIFFLRISEYGYSECSNP